MRTAKKSKPTKSRLDAETARDDEAAEADVARLPAIVAAAKELAALVPHSHLSLTVGFQFENDFRLEVYLPNGGKFIFGAPDTVND